MQITVDFDELSAAYDKWLLEYKLHPENFGDEEDEFTGRDYANFLVELLEGYNRNEG